MSLESRFRSSEHMARFLAAYQNMLALWPVTPEALDIQTDYGVTHLNVVGSPQRPPLIMLHGAQVSSPGWYRNIEPLSQHFRVYAVDVIDQAGRSAPTRKLKTAEDCATWLIGLLDALEIPQAAFIGHSQGGWQTLNLAIRHPDRVARMVLLSPGGSFSPMGLKLLFGMLPIFVRPTRSNFYRGFKSLTTAPATPDQPNPVIETFMTAALSYKPNQLTLGVVSVFSDEELQQVTIPTLLLVGSEEIIYRYGNTRVIERAKKLMPNINAVLVQGGRHLFPVDQAEAVNAQMLAFLLQ